MYHLPNNYATFPGSGLNGEISAGALPLVVDCDLPLPRSITRMEYPESNRYRDILEWLYRQLPMFQRIGSPALKYSLDNIRALCQAFGNPQFSYPVVHIAGTNGKGTVSHLLAAALQAGGLKVGLHTSPHYKDFRERIKVNGMLIPRARVKAMIRQTFPLVDELYPSFFELSTLMAFQYFREAKVDVAVIETGLGGRLDSTNVVDPVLSVITGVHFDHMAFLGDTLPKIAREKAGIIKPGKPVVIGPCSKEVLDVFTEEAKQQHALLIEAEQLVRIEVAGQNHKGSTLELYVKDQYYGQAVVPAMGPFIAENTMISLAAWQVLQDYFKLQGSAFIQGVRQLKELTQYQGRWQWLDEEPDILTDSAHNEEGISGVLEAIRALDYPQIHFVLGFVRDKAIEEMLQLFPSTGKYYFVQAKVPRALPAGEVASKAREIGLKGKPYSSVNKGLAAAKQTASSKDLIFVGGSTFVVAEVL